MYIFTAMICASMSFVPCDVVKLGFITREECESFIYHMEKQKVEWGLQVEYKCEKGNIYVGVL